MVFYPVIIGLFVPRETNKTRRKYIPVGSTAASLRPTVLLVSRGTNNQRVDYFFALNAGKF